VAVQAVSEITVAASDVAALARWYREVLRLPLLAEESDRIWLGIGNRCRLGIWTPGPKEFGDRGGRHVHFALAVDRGELFTIAQRARQRGVPCEGPVEHDGGDLSLYLRDPEDDIVELWDFFVDAAGAQDGVAALSATQDA
jgi:catechol-2,3-dioxygenase